MRRLFYGFTFFFARLQVAETFSSLRVDSTLSTFFVPDVLSIRDSNIDF